MIALYDIDALRTAPRPVDFLAALIVDRFAKHMEAAAKKNHVSELTEEEACAICLFAGLPYELDHLTGRITFRKCGMYKRDGRWVVVTKDNL